MVRNSRKKQKQTKKELEELELYFRRLMDPDLIDKCKSEVEYLDEMIKGESVGIQKLNKENTKYKRLDFVGNEVQKERTMVNIEDELMRLKGRIQGMVEQHKEAQESELKTDELIMKRLNKEEKLK